MRVCVFSQNNPGVYSGGRYHALMLAEALAHAGHDVDYITNAAPVFLSDFNALPAHRSIRMHMSDNFMPEDFDYLGIDAVFVTPGRSDHPIYYNAARFAAQRSGAQVFLINFESGNWFNALAPQRRELSQWAHWKDTVSFGGTVLSSAAESEKWAKDFYDAQGGKTRFATWSPPINIAALQAAEKSPKENRVTIIARLSDPHKGMQDIFTLLPDEMRGWTLTIISGSGDLAPEFTNAVNDMGKQRGIEIDVRLRPNDKTKFEILHASKLLIFPSLFEGYGYPPIEALACDTDVAAYDLPVIRETCGDAPYYATHGDRSALKAAIRRAVTDPDLGTRDLKRIVADLCDFDASAQRLAQIVETHAANDARTTEFNTGAHDAIFVDGIIQPLNPAQTKPGFLKLQGLRAKRMTTREGRAYYTGRVLAKLRPQPAKHKTAISECTVDEMGRFFIRGWRVGGKPANRVEARIRDKFSAVGRLGLPRPDVAKRYGDASAKHAGFEINTRIVGPAPINEPVDILFYQGDRLVDRADAIVTRFEDIEDTERRAKTQKTKAVALLADAEYARPGSAGYYRLEDISQTLRNEDLKPILVLCGNPADFHDNLPLYEQAFEEVKVCDLTRPVMLTGSDGPIAAMLKRLDTRYTVTALISSFEIDKTTLGHLQGSASHFSLSDAAVVPHDDSYASVPLKTLIPPREIERLTTRTVILLANDRDGAIQTARSLAMGLQMPPVTFSVMTNSEFTSETTANGHIINAAPPPLNAVDMLKNATCILRIGTDHTPHHDALSDRAQSYGIPVFEADDKTGNLSHVLAASISGDALALDALFDKHHGASAALIHAILAKTANGVPADRTDLEKAFQAHIEAERATKPDATDVTIINTLDPYAARLAIDEAESNGALAVTPLQIKNRASALTGLYAQRASIQTEIEILETGAAPQTGIFSIADDDALRALADDLGLLKDINFIVTGFSATSALTFRMMAALAPDVTILTADPTLRLRFPLDTRIVTLALRNPDTDAKTIATALKVWLGQDDG